MKSKHIIWIAVLILLICFLGVSQVKRIIRNDLKVTTSANILKLSDGYFSFEYIFNSDSSSHQLLCGLSIELNDKMIKYGGSLRNIIPPKEKNWGKFPTIYKEMSWTTYYDTSGLDFLELPPRSVVKPGESISFSFEAKGLPGIGLFWAEGWAKWYFTQEEEDSLLEAGYSEESLHPTDEEFFKSQTVVRRNPPNPFSFSVVIDSLISYKHQSRALGWIDNDGIVNSLDQKLENAKKQLQKGNTNSAKNIIQAFIKEVEALHKEGGQVQNGKHLSSEAYALLKYNAEYLLEKMGGK